MKRTFRTPGLSGGFSLIEVMIAVVVLATGLLALAALQGSLTRSSADAKTRSRVAAMLSARMDELRGSGYGNTILDPGTVSTTSTTDGCDGDATDWIDCARVQGNLGSLTVTETNSLWTSAVGGTTFTQVANRAGVTTGDPEFIRVTLQASWTGANAAEGTHNLAMTSEFSSLALRDSLLPPPPASGTSTGAPIVRTDNPNGPGVIPIAVGGGEATAASNPRPEEVGRKNNTTVTGTRFDVLTYNGLTGSSVIQRRVETEVLKCQCRLGAGGTNLPEIYRTSQWPAIWTGERYDVYTPSPLANAPGQGKNSGPKPGVTQSPLCQECCRDHFDGSSTTVAKFDPERSGPHQHYNLNNGTLVVPAVTDTDYVDSCRVIRVDGFWRTAADMYSRQFGLLATQPDSTGIQAKSGAPTAAATTAYQTFVKDYLKQIDGASGSPPTNAQTLFDQAPRQLNDPASIVISTVDSQDFRYLHGRGLYLDFLEAKARDKIAKILADNGPSGKCPTGTDVAECILPYLPFTTINLTELADWKATDTDILLVNSNNKLGGDANLPSGGRTSGTKKGVADTGSRINMSNTGLAASDDAFFKLNNVPVDGVDAPDATAIGTDAQRFDVGGNSGTNGDKDKFSVGISGLTTQNPYISFSVGSTGQCVKQSGATTYVCATNTSPLSGGSITLSNYWIETTTNRQVTHTCYKNGNTSDPMSATDTIAVPTFRDFTVTSAVIGTTSGSISAASNDKKKTESTVVTFLSPNLVANDLIQVTLTPQTLTDSEQYASIVSCSTNGGGNQITNIVWSKPWEQP